MPAKTTPTGRQYAVDGKTFTWTTEDGDSVTIPLRLKLKVIRGMGADTLDADTMFRILDALIPDQGDVLDEMDVNDFQAMFTVWQAEYNALSGASLGEASGSPA